MRDVERREHNPVAGQVVRFIDLKSKGIGTYRPTEDLWAEVGPEAITSRYSTARSRPRPLSSSGSRSGSLLMASAPHPAAAGQTDAFLDADSQQVHPKTRACFPEVARLKGLMDDTSRRFKVVFAGLHNVQRAARDPNTPVGHLGTPVCVGPLLDSGEWRQARDLIELPLRHMGYELSPSDLWMRILSYTNYYPSLIQVFCKHLLEYLHNKDQTSFDFRRCPPFPVTTEQVEQVYQSKGLKDEVSHKFELTLGLDPRYRLIALRIALDSLEHPGGRADGVDVGWVRSQALADWPRGFSPDDRGYELFRTILDEMVGLGVLRKAGEDRYALRSPNVLNLLGSKEQIEFKLLDVMDLPPAPLYVAAAFRRSLGGDQWARSPLTAEQEASLTEAVNGVAVVFGSRLSGLDRLEGGLRAIPNLAGVEVAERMTNLSQFEAWLREVDDGRGAQTEGVTLAVVGPSSDWTPGWVARANDILRRKTTSRKRFLRIVFVADPQVGWPLAADEDARTLGVTELTLRPWQESALRRWMEDIEFGDSHRVDEAIRKELGGWYLLVEEFARCSRENPHNWQAALAAVRARWPGASEWAGCCDIPPDARRVFTDMATYDEAIDPGDLEILIEPRLVRRPLAWADRFAYIQPVGEGSGLKWRLDPIFRQALAAGGG
ncbi:MAG: hypothetical protein U0792_06805 [Gemmataceae bacterium]